MEILKLKSIITKTKNLLQDSRWQKKIDDLEDISVETIQSEEQWGKKIEENWTEPQRTTYQHFWSSRGEKEHGKKIFFNKPPPENFQNLIF